MLTTDRCPLSCPRALCVPLFLLQPHSRRRSAPWARQGLCRPWVCPLVLGGGPDPDGLAEHPTCPLPSPRCRAVSEAVLARALRRPRGDGVAVPVVSRDLCRPLTRPRSAWGTSVTPHGGVKFSSLSGLTF